MANPRKFSEKIALHNQKQAEETAAFEKIMREVSDATNKVNSNTRRAKLKVSPESEVETILIQQALGTFRSGSLPNVAAPQPPTSEPEIIKPEEASIATQYNLGGRSGGTSPSPRSPGQRGRASSSVGPMRRPADRKHDTSPYGSTAYLSPPPDSNWRRTNSDSALHQSCGGEQPVPSQPLSPHHPLHSHAHPHAHPHQNHRRAGNIHLDVLATLGMNPTNRPRSSCEIPRIPNNNNVYESGGDGGGGGGGGGGSLALGELQVPGGSLPDLTALHFPPPHYMHRASPPYQARYQSPTSPGAVSPGGGSVSPATGGLSPASGSPVGATVPLGLHHDHQAMYDTQNHLSVPNTNNYLHHNKNMSPLDHSWMTSSYQSHCSPPSQYSSTSNINIPSPTMVHSPGSPVESPQTDYNNLHQALLQPFEQITMDWAQLVQSLVESGWTAHVQVADNMDAPTSNYNTTYINHSSPHSPQTTNSPHTYSQAHVSHASHVSHVAHEAHMTHGGHAHAHSLGHGVHHASERGSRDPIAGGNYNTHSLGHGVHHASERGSRDPIAGGAYNPHSLGHGVHHASERGSRDPVAGGAYNALQPLASPPQPPTPNTPASIPDIILTDYSGDLDAGIFGGEEAQLRAGLDLDDLTLLEEPSLLLPDSSVEHEFRLDRHDSL